MTEIRNMCWRKYHTFFCAPRYNIKSF